MKQLRYKALILDVDDTLTQNLGMPPREFIASQRLISVVNKTVDRVHMSLCTGRDKETIIKICLKLGLKSPQIIEGGAKIIDVHGETLWVKYINITSINAILNLLKRATTSFSVLIDGIEIVDTVPTSNLDKITAVLWYDLPKEQTEKIKQQLSPCRDITFAVNQDRTGNTIYITDKSGTKAHGIRKLLEILNIHKKDVIGVGDGNNDKSLLLECGLKVAMGNAVDDLKAIADYIAPTVEEDGVVNVINKFILKVKNKP